ncbi:MAG TPA: hypothetical protein V6C65_34530 [Allocoleopsis sp.]
MKPRNLLRNALFGLVGVTLFTAIACVSLQSNRPDSSPSATPSPSPTPSPEKDTTGRDRPDTKIITMNLGGRSTEVELKLYGQPALPFITYYPSKDFSPEFKPFPEGDRLRFYFSPKGKKDEEAYVSFFQPKQPTTPEVLLDRMLGDNGMFIRNQWELVDRTNIVSYPWTTEKLIYQQQTNSTLTVGAIYVGQKDGQAFYALTHYPAKYGDQFDAKANIMLENLQFKQE